MPSCLPHRPRHPGRSARSGFPASFRKLAPARKLEWLRGPEVVALVQAGVLQMSQVTAEEKRLGKERDRVRVTAPTPARVDDWERGEQFPPPIFGRREVDGQLEEERLGDPACAMRRAEHVVDEFWEGRVLWPPYYIINGGVTYEKALVINLLERGREDDGDRERGHHTTESESARAIQAAEQSGTEVGSTLHPDFELESEDVKVLAEQIQRYVQLGGGRVSRVRLGFAPYRSPEQRQDPYDR